MLNISPNSIKDRVADISFKALQQAELSKANVMFTRWIIGISLVGIIILFLPWTQNIRGKGKVTTLYPDQRPQTIHATIPGRIEQWYVREGQYVKKGDTIVHLSEVKAEYFDPELIQKTNLQIVAKENGIESYSKKADALDDQIIAYQNALSLKRKELQNKILQTQLKINADSIELERAKIDFQTAEARFGRTKKLYEKGLEPLTEFEQKNLKVQETTAKQTASEQKFLTTKNELINATIQLDNIENEYAEKIAKAYSEKYSALSAMYDSETSRNKLRIELANYQSRNQFYFITAPRDAYINKALKPGIGEIIKEGDAIVSIMPTNYQLAVELYVKPMDLPLIKLGQPVSFIFDGWPAFIFSGWPGSSFGTYHGKVFAIDNIISDNGEFRVLVAPYEEKKPWPDEVKAGSGAEGFALLNRVSIWYEIWRQLNGFPPDYYKGEENSNVPKLKAPIQSVAK